MITLFLKKFCLWSVTACWDINSLPGLANTISPQIRLISWLIWWYCGVEAGGFMLGKKQVIDLSHWLECPLSTLLRGILSHAAMISNDLQLCMARAEPRSGSRKAKGVSVPGSCSRSGGVANATAEKVSTRKGPQFGQRAEPWPATTLVLGWSIFLGILWSSLKNATFLPGLGFCSLLQMFGKKRASWETARLL